MIEIKDYLHDKETLCRESGAIPAELFREYGVNRGLRDLNGKGVLTGLTNISKIVSFRDGVPCEGELWYRGYCVEDLIASLGGAPGFEKTAFLLLFGRLPDEAEKAEFEEILGGYRLSLPKNFVRDVVMKRPTKDIMNSMTCSMLKLASYDRTTGSSELSDNIGQCLRLIAVFPLLAAYGYHAYNHYENGGSMYIHVPDPKLSAAENFLSLLRPDGRFDPLEAQVLDIALMLHMEHGGGNNSTFTTRVVTSSGSDTYSTIAAAMSSLKGPRHGGANLKVMEMMDDIRANVSDIGDRKEVSAYVARIVDKETFDRQGLVYGMGHAVYSVSDPRERVLRGFVEKLAAAKGREKDLGLYRIVEEEAPKIIAEKRRIYKGVSPNVDFYSGFVYDMLGLPVELYTPLFAIARVVGWSAHRLEELVGGGKIIRPAYLSVMKELGGAGETTQEDLC
ncbi:MAG: citrate synthase [Clostridiales bacterium]|nr:citrate synthase [Clostridiales bacterium]